MVTQVTKTIDDFVLEVREIVNDQQFPYRYSDSWVIQILNTCLRDLYRLRPDAYIGNFTTGVLSANPVNTYSKTDLQNYDGTANPMPPVPATPFPVDDRLFFGPVVFYGVGRLEISDDEFTDDNRAMTLYNAFKSMLTVSGGG
ncbi:MAG: hypothetical protein ACHQ9S_18845 [Candidatus Binatia bacterium]